MIVGKFKSVDVYNFKNSKDSPVRLRAFRLCPGDQFTVNAYGIEKSFGVKIKDIDLGTRYYFGCELICMNKIKRKWWQIWKPKYVAATFMVI